MFSRKKPALLQEAEEIRQLIRRVHARVDRVRAEHDRENGLTRLQGQIVEALHQTPGLSLKELTGAFQLSHSTVSEALTGLERMKFIERRRDEADARVTRHHLVPRVRRLVRTRFSSVLCSDLANRLSRAKATERQQIRNTLKRLADLMDEEL
ncbi:MAG: helix-turn-helix domain-containing protein [Myxococcaceae bacterium]